MLHEDKASSILTRAKWIVRWGDLWFEHRKANQREADAENVAAFGSPSMRGGGR